LDTGKYDLTIKEFLRGLMMAEAVLFTGVKSRKNPESIFVVGQPGAGKTGLKGFVLSENNLNLSECVDINPDQIAAFHKYSDEVIANCPSDSHRILQKFVRPVLDGYLRLKAVQLRCDIIQEGTFASDGYIDILRFQRNGGKNAPIGRVVETPGMDHVGDFDQIKREGVDVEGGYDVEIDILAVSRFDSLLSSYEREQYFREHQLPPRAVTKENHDRSYSALLDTLDTVEREKLYSKIKVFKRGYREDRPELIYESGDPRFKSVSDAVRAARKEETNKLLKNPGNYRMKIKRLLEKNLEPTLREKVEDLGEEFEEAVKNYSKLGRDIPE